MSNLTNSQFSNNTFYGVYVSRPNGDNNFRNLVVKDNLVYDFYYVSVTLESRCNDNYTNITTTGDLPYGYFNTASSLIENQDFSQLVMCNADNSIVRNVSVINSGTNGVFGILASGVLYDNVRFVNNRKIEFYTIDIFNNSYFESNINFDFGSGPRFYNNTFYDMNLSSVWNAIWNTSTYGNKYLNSDGSGFSQTCVDVDNNSICDTFYNITTGSIDYFPQYVLYVPVVSSSASQVFPAFGLFSFLLFFVEMMFDFWRIEYE